MLDVQKAILLKVSPSGESYLNLHALSADAGSFYCLKRISKKTVKEAPDLFDTAEIHLETAKVGTTQFVREYRTIHRRSKIGQSYQTLQYASEYANLLSRNAAHMPDPAVLFQLAERTFDAFTERDAASIVSLKGIYLLLQGEGYPVRESWWPQIPEDLREVTKQLINQPTPEEPTTEILEASEAIRDNLTRWIKRETEMII
ncbi:MAG: hypothetical protein AAF546_10625 [Verrucomicrobiota bacterium]